MAASLDVPTGSVTIIRRKTRAAGQKICSACTSSWLRSVQREQAEVEGSEEKVSRVVE